VRESLETQYLKMLLCSQMEFDTQYSKNILGFHAEKRICHYLNHLAKYSNDDDFKVFMRNKTYHKTKTDFLIIILCLLNMSDQKLDTTQTITSQSYNSLLKTIFFKKDEWDHTANLEWKDSMFESLKVLYQKYIHDFGFISMSWLDQRRKEWYNKLETQKLKDHANDTLEYVDKYEKGKNYERRRTGKRNTTISTKTKVGS
jgi:hypothetical protein